MCNGMFLVTALTISINKLKSSVQSSCHLYRNFMTKSSSLGPLTTVRLINIIHCIMV